MPSALAVFMTLGCGPTSDADDARRVDVTSAGVKAAIAGNTRVALELHGALRTREGNLFYSPLGAEAVVAMVYAGSAGQSAAQLAAVLDAGMDPPAFHAGLGALLDDLGGEHPGRGYTLALANRLFGASSLKPRPLAGCRPSMRFD